MRHAGAGWLGLVLWSVVAGAAPAYPQDGGTERSAMVQPPGIGSAAEATTQAVRLTHLDSASRKTTARRVTVATADTPFLWRQLIGKAAWRVDFEDASLKLRSAVPGFPDAYRRTFTVLLDESSGQLLGVASPFDGHDPDLRPLPSGDVAERQLRSEQEVYHGLPAHAPKLSFVEALDRVLTGGIGSPFLAKEIHAVYVLHSRMGSPPRPVWVITLRGLPPMTVRGPDAGSIPVWQRNHMRNVVDAETGDVLFATNSPQPE